MAYKIIMFLQQRFKQQYNPNASTTDQELSQHAEDHPQFNSQQKHLKTRQFNKSLCAKKHLPQPRSKKYSLQHRNNPQQPNTQTKQWKKEPQIINQGVNSQFFLKIKENNSSSVTAMMRLILIDWLLQVVADLQLSKEALHTAVHYLDELLLKLPITKHQLQVYGLCCLIIAQKLQSQSILTPAQASQLLHYHCSQKDLIEIEEIIMKTLRFKLHPVTLWTETGILLRAFESYFREKLTFEWEQCKQKAFWIIQGVCMHRNYFDKAIGQRDICLCLLRCLIGHYNPPLLRYFSAFCKSITGSGYAEGQLGKETKMIERWMGRHCECQQARYSPSQYHPELKLMAVSCIRQ